MSKGEDKFWNQDQIVRWVLDPVSRQTIQECDWDRFVTDGRQLRGILHGGIESLLGQFEHYLELLRVQQRAAEQEVHPAFGIALGELVQTGEHGRDTATGYSCHRHEVSVAEEYPFKITCGECNEVLHSNEHDAFGLNFATTGVGMQVQLHPYRSVEEKFGEQNFRVLSEMRFLRKIRVGV